MAKGKDNKGKFTLSNMFWQNRSKDGADPYYDSPEEMMERIYEYLQHEEQHSKGKFTVEGCALWLGFKSRQSLHDYKKKSDFSYIIERFFLFMSHYHAQRLTWVGSFQGSKFWLTNFGGYSEETVQQVNQTVTAKYGGDTIHTTSKPNTDTPSDK